MKKLVLFFLLLTLSATWSVSVGVRRSPPGDIIESRRPNLTLHCDVLETESDPVESVIWYYEGEVFRQITDEECHHQPALAEFLHHELGSWLEDSSEGSSEGSSETDGVLLEEDLLSSGDYIAEETGGSGEAPHILCGAQTRQLSLTEVTRQVSGRYACAAVSGGLVGARSEEMELSVECKSDFVFIFISLAELTRLHTPLQTNTECQINSGSRQLSLITMIY